MRQSDSIFKTAKATTTSFYRYYRIYTKGAYKARRRVMGSPSNVSKIISLFLKLVREHYLYDEGGVYLKKLGYFCTMICPKRSRRMEIVKGNNWTDRTSTNGYYYKHLVLPVKGESYVFTLYDRLARQKRRLMRQGVRYKFLHRELALKYIIDEKGKHDRDLRFYDGLDLDKILKRLKIVEPKKKEEESEG